MEWNDYNNAQRGPAVKAACEEFGLVYTIWLTRPFTAASARQAAVESGAAGVLLEGEIPAMNPDTSWRVVQRLRQRYHQVDHPGIKVGEIPNPQAVNWPEVIFLLSDLNIFKGVVTNFSPFTHHDGTPYPEKAAPLINAGWACLTECYDMIGDPALWIERRKFFAGHLGWFATQPVLGLYSGRTFASYPGYESERNWSVWAAEYVL